MTTVHVRKAVSGDADSLAWLFEHFSGLLLSQAVFRLAQTQELRPAVEAEDLVQQTWAVAIPRLPDLHPRDGRLTPVLVKFLGTTLLRLYTDLLRSRLGKEQQAALSDPDEVIKRIPGQETSVSKRLIRSERAAAVHRCISELPPTDREILILRGIEQAPYALLAPRLGASEGTLRVRYHAALQRLAKVLTPEIADELADRRPGMPEDG